VLKLRGYKFLLKPSAEQETRFAQQVGACRFVYNLALEQRGMYRPKGHPLNPDGRRVSFADQCKQVVTLREEVDWLADVHGHALIQALKDLDKAFTNFFEGRASYPKPRVKGVHDSFRVPQDKKAIRVKKLNGNWSAVKLPKLGWIKYRSHRAIEGEIRNATVSLKGGHWWVSIQTEAGIEIEPSALPPVGIDRGVVVLAALSTGELIEPGSALRKHSRRLKNAQRCLARRRRGSNRYRRQKARVGRIHKQIANTRRDQLHKVALGIARRFGTVVFEDLKTRNMTASAAGTIEAPGRNVAQKSGLNRVILDKGWHTLEAFLAYKLQERGGALVKVNPAYSSQTCPCCGSVSKHHRKSQAVFDCGDCGHKEHADIVGAKNILRAGARLLSAPSEPHRRSATRTIKRRLTHAA